MSRRLFDLVGPLPVYPGTDGMSGIMLRYLSTDLLNVSTETSVRSLISLGRELKSLGPLMAKLFSLIVEILAEQPVWRIGGILQYTPLHSLLMVVTGFMVKLGARFWMIFQM